MSTASFQQQINNILTMKKICSIMKPHQFSDEFQLKGDFTMIPTFTVVCWTMAAFMFGTLF